MSSPKMRAALVALALVVGLPGCTNTRQDVSVWDAAKTIWNARKTPTAAAPDERLIALEVKRALESDPGPLMLMRFERNKTIAVLRRIETNGQYWTWTTWGRLERRSITTKRGVVTATRGLGWDLMLSDVDHLLAMVETLGDGIRQQKLRHLDGENRIVESVADCAFTPDEPERYTAGTLDQTAVRVDVFCKTASGSFNNYYLVSRSGQILQANQWLGPNLGHVTMWKLR